MSNPGTPSLDQLNVFLAVVETGSFAAAARRQGRAVSAVSYAIANLEAQLGLPLFDRHATRKPQLTQAGHAVLAEARAVTRGVDDLRAKVKGLLEGLEAEVSLVVDVMFPTTRLVDALQAFQAAFPTVTMRLHVEALGAVTQLVRDGVAGVGVSGPLPVEGEELGRIGVGTVDLVPVAAPFHPLARGRGQAPGAARSHTQLVLTDRSKLTEGRDFAVLSLNTWRLADLGAKHALLLAGIGWGNMPTCMVQGDLEAGRLVELHLPDYAGGQYAFQALYRPAAPPGPAAQWLIDRFVEQAAATA